MKCELNRDLCDSLFTVTADASMPSMKNRKSKRPELKEVGRIEKAHTPNESLVA